MDDLFTETDCVVTALDENGESGVIIKTKKGPVYAKIIILATEGNLAERIRSNFLEILHLKFKNKDLLIASNMPSAQKFRS